MRKAARKKAGGQEGSVGIEQRLLPIASLMFTLRRGLREFVVEAEHAGPVAT